MKYIVILCSMVAGLFVGCEFSGSRYDPEGGGYIRPSFTINKERSSITDKDTIASDSIVITLNGNDDQRCNSFRWKMDTSAWSPWGGFGHDEYVISVRIATPGSHMVKMQVCYDSINGEREESVITFYLGSKPQVTASVASPLLVDAEAACTLWVKATGTGTLTYAWYRGTEPLAEATDDTLIFKSVTVGNSAVYSCRVYNQQDSVVYDGMKLSVLLRVRYDGNENTGGSVPKDTNRYEVGKPGRAMDNVGGLVRRGYTFGGWNTQRDGNGETFDPNELFLVGSEHLTLFAKWNPNEAFIVAYDGNGMTGGKVPDTARAYRTGEVVTVADNSGILVKESVTFIGWNTGIDGNGTGFHAGDTFTMGTEPVTLYAQWTEKSIFTIIYNGNDNSTGEPPVREIVYETGKNATIGGNGTLAKDGYTFTGWNTIADGSGKLYRPDTVIVTGAGSLVLFAQWTEKQTFTLTYDGNGNSAGDPPMRSVVYEVGDTVTISNYGTLVKSGYTFTGWNTASDGSGMVYMPDTVIIATSGGIALYAQWCEKQTFMITYDGNGNTAGEPPVRQIEYEAGQYITIKGPGTLVKEGYTFTGWNSAANGNGTAYAADAVVFVENGAVVLYAQWMKNPTFTLTYDGNGNTAGDPPVRQIEYEAGRSITILGRGTLVKTGYTFDGWNTAPNGTGTAYPAGTVIPVGGGSLTLYAQWK